MAGRSSERGGGGVRAAGLAGRSGAHEGRVQLPTSRTSPPRASQGLGKSAPKAPGGGMKMVIGQLEGILQELKEVAKELREVVSQIDRLTSDFDFELEPDDWTTATASSTSSSDKGMGGGELGPLDLLASDILSDSWEFCSFLEASTPSDSGEGEPRRAPAALRRRPHTRSSGTQTVADKSTQTALPYVPAKQRVKSKN
ncbi:PREDICTED: UPF0583 protein C15orf59 homolog [Tinamus guttatus]|uniref:UPF0583 protein C15orf59 homolog n=1 Tax=Tinamus guttatus TaxID=94827 RepID=UPI00052E9A52|nr:PREDICTED: UPF0583 protein C15orf59 homolog [Tinamus guttatus]